jgi:catechol 2,3-dioxygenase
MSYSAKMQNLFAIVLIEIPEFASRDRPKRKRSENQRDERPRALAASAEALPPAIREEVMTQTQTKFRPPTLHHVNLKTSRLDEMVEWYGLVIGADVQFRNEVAAWTANDEANHRIAFLAVPGLSDDVDKVRHNGMHHCAFEFESFGDLMNNFDRLRGAGVEPAFCLDHGMTISLYYKDPEGNFVELQSDVFCDWKLSSEYMRKSPEFAENPIGVFFDPARVYASFEAGADFQALERSIRAGDYLPNPVPSIGLPT